jgi:prepilin-type N-terminal cleavage/methylation domain-containing protein
MKQKQSGFTLIEIAIVLVIIGLLLGGVLKGQELINSAKVKNLSTDFKNVPVFIYGYQDKFKALPGDDINAASHVGATGTIGNGNGIIEGTWDTTDTTKETQTFWLDVRLANLAPGPTTGDLLPTNSVGGVIGIASGDSTNNPTPSTDRISGTYIICSSSILGKYASQMDTTLDDGNPSTGSMRAYDQAGGRGTALSAPTLVSGQLDPAAPYVVCMGV